MAGLFRFGIGKCVTGLGPKQEKLSVAFRTITSKALRDQDPDRPPKPKPWPYNHKSYTRINYFFDRTTARIDENSKIVVVEGPVASGKSQLAKHLAKELDMLYLPEANPDMILINKYGFDLRKLDSQLPESVQSHDISKFLLTPKHVNTCSFQIRQYNVKFSQYVDALAHLLSTGQGIVLDRCCYSDFVFTEAMYSQGYITKEAKKLYYEIRSNTISELLRPHLVIYLDVPVNKTLENIKKRNLIVEKNSEVLTPEYLGVMEKAYKQKYLKEINKHAELLIYDWSEGGEFEVVVEDIERIDFKIKLNEQETKLKDWDMGLEDDWGCARNRYADEKASLLAYFNVPCFEVPEMMIDAEDAKIYWDVINSTPGEMYEVGYNKAMGDTGLLWKTSKPPRDTLPLTERKLS